MFLGTLAAVAVLALLVWTVVLQQRQAQVAQERSDRIVRVLLDEMQRPSGGSPRSELFDRVERIEHDVDTLLEVCGEP